MFVSLVLSLLLSQNPGINDRHFEQMIDALNLLGQEAEQATDMKKDDLGDPLIEPEESRQIVTFTMSAKTIVQRAIANKKWYPVVEKNYATLTKALHDRTKSNLKSPLTHFETTLRLVKP